MDGLFGYFNSLDHFLRGRRLQPMTACGRYLARLDRGDHDYLADGEVISEELVAALKRIAITSARDA